MPPPIIVQSNVACFQCDIGLPNGAPCNQGKPFVGKKAYLTHLQQQHHISETESQNQFVITNVCPLCENVFKTRVTAVNHFQRSIQQGRCKGRSKDQHSIVSPVSFKCRRCEHVAVDLFALHKHFRDSHFDFVEASHLAQANNN